jgi:hypothetical protein
MNWAQVESMSEAAIAEQLFPPQKANRTCRTGLGPG